MIQRVDGPDDPRLHPYHHVADPAWLRRQALFVAEGRLVVERLIALRRHRIRSVLVSDAALRALRVPLQAVEGDVFVCGAEVLRAVTGFNFHRGCLALAERPSPCGLEAFWSATRVVAVQGVGNPDNVGGLFRAAAALGADGIVLGPACADPLYRKAIRTSMGAALRLPFVQVDDWMSSLMLMQAGGFRLIALTPRAGAEPLAAVAASLAPAQPLALLLGSEGEGLDERTLAAADMRVRIPIDSRVDSLNVVIAAAIALDRLR